MNQNSLSKWLKCIIVLIGGCGILVYGWIIPSFGRDLSEANPEFAYCYLPWLILIWVTGIPCCVALAFAWRVAANIGKGRSFSMENSRLLKRISVLAITDTAFFFAMNIVYLLLNMGHPGIVLLSLLVLAAGIAISVAAAALSHLVLKAAMLQEQSDLTV